MKFLVKDHESFVMLLAALLNSIAGIVIDLYAPCLPTIGHELHVSTVTMQNTIGASVIGFALGQLMFGILCDWKGRKTSIIIGLILFILASLLATMAYSITLLMVARIIQGLAAGSCPVIARAILIDEVKGHRFGIGVVYLSMAFALGIILGPYLGALIEQSLGWRWDFVFYAIYALVLLVIVLSGMRESLPKSKAPLATLISYKEILSHPVFVCSFIQLGCCFVAFTVWNQIGPFIIEHELGESATYFGLTALVSGVFYLTGTICNRLLIHRTDSAWRINLSSGIFLVGTILLALGGYTLNIYSLLSGLMIVMLAQGMAFPNVLSQAIAIFPDKAGVSASLQGAGTLIIGFLGLSLISVVPINTCFEMGVMYFVLLMIFFIVKVKAQKN